MRVVALEEHFTVPALVQRFDQNAISRRGFRSRNPPTTDLNTLELLPEIGERRLQSMDEAGITVQVLSNSCVYRKVKLGRSGGEVRQGWRMI